MKKLLFLIALVAMTFGNVSNTNAQTDQERSDRRAEMQARQKERLMKDLKLTDEQRAKFDPIYDRYQAELGALRPQREQTDGETGASQQTSKDKKELTDAVATARLQELFTHQEQQIQQSQQRLDIQKKYCAEFSSFLTPQQLLRVFQPQQNRNRAQMGGRGQGGPRGGFGGGFGGPRGGFGGPDGF